MAIIYTAKAVCDKEGTKHEYVYIGKTNRSLEQRKKEHIIGAYANNKPDSFHQTMRKMAPDDWVFTAEFTCDDSESINKEKELIQQYREIAKHSRSLIILNDTDGKNLVNGQTVPKPDYGIPRANKQRNYSPGEMGKKFARLSGQLKPVINLKTQKIYNSVLEAERKENVSRATIKISCNTGKKLADDSRYAYLDINDNAILSEGHSQDHYIGRSARKVKELISGIIYNDSDEVSQKYKLSSSSVGGFASGKYLIAKKQYIFCYLDENGAEIITKRHEIALQMIKKKEKINYVAWPVVFSYEDAESQKEVSYFKTLDDVYKGLNLKNKSHIKAVCDGDRSHVDGYRIAYYDSDINKPKLMARHLSSSKKIIRKVQCINDGSIYNNCTDAGCKYSVNPNQIGLCAKGILKSVRVKNKEDGKTERLSFAYLDKSGRPLLTPKHNEPLLQRKGIAKIVLINSSTIEHFGTSTFSSLAEYCRVTGVPPKRARKYLTNKAIDMFGLEFIVVE